MCVQVTINSKSHESTHMRSNSNRHENTQTTYRNLENFETQQVTGSLVCMADLKERLQL